MIKENVVIAGAGLGGLLSGAFLSKYDYKPLIIEETNEVGGRFRNLNYKGYILSTGALHTVPHGDSGPLAKLIQNLDLNVKIINSKPRCGVFLIEDKYIPAERTLDIIKLSRNWTERIEMTKIFMKMIFSMKHYQNSFKDWFFENSDNEYIYNIFDTICRFSIGTWGDRIEASGFHSLVKHVSWFGGSGIIKGGCSSVVDELEKYILSHGGKIEKKCSIKEIIVKGEIEKIIIEKSGKLDEIDCEYLISNLGPHKTDVLLKGDNISKRNLEKWKPINGIKISISSKKRIFNHTGILWTVSAENVSGIVEVTNADSSLAPKDKHLLIAYHALDEKKNIEKQIESMKEELKRIIPDFNRNCEFLLTQIYHSNFPVNWAPHHSGIEPKIHIKNLYFVGDSINTPYTMAERVAKSVETVIKDFKR
jgi:phytoene dehydrogenase-like protein